MKVCPSKKEINKIINRRIVKRFMNWKCIDPPFGRGDSYFAGLPVDGRYWDKFCGYSHWWEFTDCHPKTGQFFSSKLIRMFTVRNATGENIIPGAMYRLSPNTKCALALADNRTKNPYRACEYTPLVPDGDYFWVHD